MQEPMKNIKLYGIFHKEFPKPSGCDWLIPISVGNAHISNCNFSDSEGVNISHLNPYYCELTAQYWVRHNRPSQYVGFYHYRRYFSFIQDTNNIDQTNIFSFLSSDLQYTKLAKLLNVYDVVLPRSHILNMTIEDQYIYSSSCGLGLFFDGIRGAFSKIF
jgi:hypothetical protein